MRSIEDIVYRNYLFSFFDTYADFIVSYFENYATYSSISIFFYEFIIPEVRELEFPPLMYDKFLNRFDELMFLLTVSGHSHFLNRICECNDFMYDSNDIRDCGHERIFQLFLVEIKKIITNFDLFKILWDLPVNISDTSLLFYKNRNNY